MLLSGVAQALENGNGLRLQKMSEQVYAVVGPYGGRTPQNLGNNATFGFVVTDEGVVLIDSGGTYQGAEAIDRLIKQVTDKPVKYVLNSGGQDHRWLGNGYFKERGARVIASEAVVADQHKRLQDQMFMLGNQVGEKEIVGTEPVYADETFTDSMRFILGSTVFELQRVGPAHT
ncbi:MBL fold metallo-hydrolase, partial [Thiolapillus sp.]